MTEDSLAHEINPAETYQIDSDEYDSDQERDDINDEEYDRLVEEAENGYSDEEMKAFTHQLKESGLVNFLRDYLSPNGSSEPRSLRKLLLGFGIIPPVGLRNPSTPNILLLSYAKIALSRILRRRERLSHLSSVEDALNLLRTSKRIIILSGAGISTSCGIPDFRSSTGLYAQLQDEGRYELDDPQQMFDIRYFRERPEVFYSFAKQIYPSNFVPSPCHRWIKMLEDRGQLLRNYTQNIDTLENLAGVTKVLQCHGSFSTASCLRCKTRVPGPTIEPYIMAQKVPYCGACREARDQEIEARRKQREAAKKSKGKGKARAWGNGDDDDDEDSDESEWGGGEPGIIKPDITFFGQALDSEFDECLFKDREEVDLLLIIGTSLKVAPVSEVLTHIPHSVPQIFINLTPVHHVQPDICLLGDADSIVTYLSSQLGWTIPPPPVVLHPNGAETSVPAIENDEIHPTKRDLRVTIPPEEAEWFDGVGDMQHIHLLRKKGSKEINIPLSPSDSGTDSTVDENDEERGPDEDRKNSKAEELANGKEINTTPESDSDHDSIKSENVDEDEDGDGDEDRPSKRTRMD
ncbi:hypothetical protein CI109_106144 [Kwoniella shandongensis]|uniref:Uncharacterized protein n=1 Tax=Kwoniella shandongensis TaxID=1734106 RepID=A0A5M6BZG8_9TREE|nr:uncharacterized protein CI109_003752 [Kwoniella shandongensis]KAA5527781.1 hypothetical protein CI109_003752 [Kwoniella shandongensis]